MRHWFSINLEKLRKLKVSRYITSLTNRGLSLGTNVYLNDGFFIDPSHCHLISIEDNVVFGPGVKVFAHDASSLKVIGKTRIAPVRIGRNSFIGAGTIILPGSDIGEDAIIGAGSVVKGNIPRAEVWAGNQLRKICSVEDYRKKLLGFSLPEFDEAVYKQENLDSNRVKEMQDKVRGFNGGFLFKA